MNDAAGAMSVHHFGPDVGEVGGMATVIATLAEHRIGADDVVVHATWSMHSRRQTVAGTLRALGAIARLPRDAIVHAHVSEGGSFVREGLLVVAARRRGLRTAVTIHGADFEAFVAQRRRLVAGVLRHAALITCLAGEHVEIARALAPRATVAYVPNPVLIDEDPGDAAHTPPTAIFAGEIGLRKGVDVLLEAWPGVRRAVPGAQCVLVGPTTELPVPSLEGLVVLEPVAQPRVRELLKGARCTVLPSRAEALPMTLLESMACARPFISTPVGGIPTLAVGGRLVPVGDADGLAGALAELLGDPAVAGEIGRRGQEACAATRGIPVVDAQLRALYGALARP